MLLPEQAARGSEKLLNLGSRTLYQKLSRKSRKFLNKNETIHKTFIIGWSMFYVLFFGISKKTSDSLSGINRIRHSLVCGVPGIPSTAAKPQ